MSFNKISILGNLGRDPELRYTPQGTPVCDFSVATSEKRKDSSGEPQEITTWFKVTFWGRQAELASQYLAKGRQVFVEGRLSQREWTDREGAKRHSLEVHGTDMHFIGSRSDEQTRPVVANAAAATADTSGPTDSQSAGEEDVPF